jgi:hypothetical protein
MSQNQQAVGLDVGTSRIVVARRTGSGTDPGEEFRYESQLNAFVSIPYSKITATTLMREQIPHTVEASEIMVHGNDSEKFAGLLNGEIRRPMNRGVLDPTEPASLKMIQEILTRMLGPGSKNSPAIEKPRKICFTIPAAPLGSEDRLTYHEATLRQILTDLGYQPSSINEGLAVVYAEMERSNYTGIGISCGGGLCNVCLAYLSVPVISFSIPKAGDYIDMSASQVTGERANRIRLAKEDSFHFNGFFADKVQQVISVYYDDMIRSLVTAMKDAFARTSNLPNFNLPVPIVLSGGTALPEGFRDRFEKLLWEQDFPIRVSEIRLAGNPLHSTAKGALACALSDL